MADESKNPYRSPAAVAPVGTWAGSAETRQQRAVLVVAIYLVIAVGNVVAILRPEAALIRLALHVAMASIATMWCVVDSRIRGFPLVNSSHWVIFFTWPIAVPIYLIYSRRLYGLGLVILHGIGLTAAAMGTYHLTALLVYGPAWLGAIE
jgi:hypothetical protein